VVYCMGYESLHAISRYDVGRAGPGPMFFYLIFGPGLISITFYFIPWANIN
jgi:hypothetical protein